MTCSRRRRPSKAGTLTLTINGPHNIQVKDEKGDIADVIVYDILPSNGVIFSVDHVVLPG